MPPIPCCAPVRKTMPYAIPSTTTVRNAVARFELTPSLPTFARIEENAANTADKNAKTAHIIFRNSVLRCNPQSAVFENGFPQGFGIRPETLNMQHSF